MASVSVELGSPGTLDVLLDVGSVSALIAALNLLDEGIDGLGLGLPLLR